MTLQRILHPLRYDAADSLAAERYAITEGGKRVLALALAEEATAFIDRLKSAFDAEEQPAYEDADQRLGGHDELADNASRESPASRFGCSCGCHHDPEVKGA